MDKKFLEQLLKVRPRLGAGQVAAASGGATAAMDISDGLSSSLYQLMHLNHLGFRIEADAVPITNGAMPSQKALEHALHSGGDYELLLTVTPHALKRVQQAVESAGTSLTSIGQVIDKKSVILAYDETEKTLPNRGFEHFRPHRKTL
jgi:thiamine-monophosphate kinase